MFSPKKVEETLLQTKILKQSSRTEEYISTILAG